MSMRARVTSWRKRLNSTSPFTPASSSRCARCAIDEKNGESFTATGIETAERTRCAASTIFWSMVLPGTAGSVATM